ncbi:GvpL/GvpF family gas vesicle protein [Streptomyces sp. NPDC048436]|uniref:GvpL/GvpF family gas vesicle protein n=1 Tax=Streptomyces sp. NPDC048436 TaxID=3365550 RepID=UPI00371E0DF8
MPTYIYAITAADHPMELGGLKGVGEPPTELRTVRTQALTAVVSDVPEGLRAKRRDLVAHQSVLERLMADGSALPMRFGLVGSDDNQVQVVLDEQQDAYIARLGEVDGCLEFNLKASRDEDDLLHEIVEESAEVRRLNELTRQNPGAQDEKVALGELIAQEVSAREESDGQSLVERLAPSAVRTVVSQPTKDHFLNVSFLVKRAEAAAFSQALHELAEERGEAYTLNVNGPLPPYSFV